MSLPLFVIVFAVFWPQTQGAQAEQGAVEREVRRLAKDVGEQRGPEAAQQLVLLHAVVARELIAGLPQSLVDANAIYLVSHYRTSDSQRIVIENICFRDSSKADGTASPFAEYPCALVLLHEGWNSIPAILRYLATTDAAKVTDEAIELYANVLIGVIGRRPEQSQCLLSIVASFKADAAHAKNLDRLSARIAAKTSK